MNIGDIAHTPGMLQLLQNAFPVKAIGRNIFPAKSPVPAPPARNPGMLGELYRTS